MPAVIVEKADGIVTVTLNRPEKKNAVNCEVMCLLHDAWREADADAGTRCVILTGAGDTEILQGTDIRVAGESAVFGVTEVQRGLFPMAGSTVRLRRQIFYTPSRRRCSSAASSAGLTSQGAGPAGRSRAGTSARRGPGRARRAARS